MLRTAIVIPARYGSTRFPGKPLAPIAGRSLIERVWRIAAQVMDPARVLVATDDQRIVDHVEGFGGKAQLTDPLCDTGSARVLDAVVRSKLQIDRVINLQGDAVLTPPWVLRGVVDQLCSLKFPGIVTPATPLSWAQYDALAVIKARGEVSGTLVTCNRAGRALYFSKSMIPYSRTRDSQFCPASRHIGIYGYQIAVLKQLLELAPSPLELCEGLEQLRALENGIDVQVVSVDYRGRTHASIDSPNDIARVEALIAAEGELT